MKRQIEAIIKKYFKDGKADKLKTDGYNEIKRLIWRNGGLWKDYKNLVGGYILETQQELYNEFKEQHLSKIDDVIKSQLAQIIETTKNNFNGTAVKTQEIIKNALEKSYVDGKKWEDIARRSFEKIKLEERHIVTEIETAKSALNNLKRYKNFTDASDKNIFYRYDGPETERVFCIDHLNKVYNLDELSTMVNQFGQPAFSYCGGYNCRHRWVPVIGKMENENLFIDDSWQNKYNSASKNTKSIMDNEKDFAQKAVSLGNKVELNSSLDKKYGKDTDLIFNGSYAQLKQPTTNNINSLGRLPNSKQADTIIIEIVNVPRNVKRLLGKYQNWLKNHNNKRIILSINNNFEDIKP